MNNLLKLSAAAGLLAVTVAGCGGGGSNGGPGTGGGTGGGGTGGVTTFTQQERLSRPLVNEVLATLGDGRHMVNNTIVPTQDPSELPKDIERFLTEVAGRDTATKNVIKSVLVPDVMVADLSKAGPAAYLGVETNGATGGTFGGRKYRDDVVDISLGIIFGNTVSALGLAPNDGKATPSLTSDNVGPEAHQYSNTFPYLGTPH